MFNFAFDTRISKNTPGIDTPLRIDRCTMGQLPPKRGEKHFPWEIACARFVQRNLPLFSVSLEMAESAL